MRVSLDHVHVFASDASATVRFFQTMFDANVVWDEVVAGTRGIRLQIGRAFILVYDQPPKGPRSGAVHHLGIETDDLDGLVGAMTARGFHFRNPIREDATFKYVMVAGPDDLLIELFECHEPARWRIQVHEERSAGVAAVRGSDSARALHHLSLGTAHIERAVAFYDAALAALGLVRVWSDLRPGETGQAVGYGVPGGGDALAIKQVDARAGVAAAGFHVALAAANRNEVAMFHAAALAAGGTDNGAPGLRPHYGPDYFAAFVVDPDGHHLEAVYNQAS